MGPPFDPTLDALQGDGCPSCGHSPDRPTARCPRCGTPLGDAVDDLRREGERRRRRIGSRKATADLLFLGGLLAGGPLLSFGVEARLGLFLILAGGVASVGRRYTSWSTPGTVVVGGLLAALLATVLVDPGESGEQDEADLAGRVAYVERLGDRLLDEGVYVEARGPERRIVWLYVPSADEERCGDLPGPEVRSHLADVGVQRVVVAGRRGQKGVCSFTP